MRLDGLNLTEKMLAEPILNQPNEQLQRLRMRSSTDRRRQHCWKIRWRSAEMSIRTYPRILRCCRNSINTGSSCWNWVQRISRREKRRERGESRSNSWSRRTRLLSIRGQKTIWWTRATNQWTLMSHGCRNCW